MNVTLPPAASTPAAAARPPFLTVDQNGSLAAPPMTAIVMPLPPPALLVPAAVVDLDAAGLTPLHAASASAAMVTGTITATRSTAVLLATPNRFRCFIAFLHLCGGTGLRASSSDEIDQGPG